MIAVLEKCIKCGKQFLRGVFPQRICEQCEIKTEIKVYTAKTETPMNTDKYAGA